ncbi:hypothetical protein SRABI118_04274 [Massilia sp. Bi118]|uniref:T6SS immunity protein Tli4 family protein n=1 Tax=Massilia sp. Bi118 TaxID=2822346 RepID=UPI001D4AD84A|nr:T6SS immunity protein Tli4 family protein [Massilia sp. Bi118]CAH0297419.1 hypothetical protein SRABI118_04274 [Massilia sp. Bi118]
MDKARNRTLPFIRVLAALYVLYLIYGLGNSMIDRHSVTKLTEQMKTACVGRFLIDLPASMDVSYHGVYVNGFWISTQTESQQAFDARILARQTAIEAEPNQRGGKNLEAVEKYSNSGFEGKIFRFGREFTKGIEDGKPVVWVNVRMEAYLHLNGVSFNFTTPDGYDADKTGNLRTLLDKLRFVPAGESPAAAGFCFGPGMFVEPLSADDTEGVTIFAGFQDHPDLSLALTTRAGTKPDREDRLARDTAVDAEMPLWQKPLMDKLRKGKRSINGIEGGEVAERWTELNFVHTFGFNWEVNGTEDNVYIPFMQLEMSTGHPVNAGARPVTSFLGEDGLLQLWDKISSSIRIRPTGAPPKREPPPGPKPGDTSAAGDICPGTGWWQCQDGGNGARVAGGQRQFLTAGQRMPQALLSRPQTLWNKLRGVQASYRLEQPTSWTLVDRRSRTRLLPAVPPADAGAA